MPGFDDWFDGHAAAWGEEHDAEVTIDRLPVGRLPEVAAAEIAAGRGHDLFGFLGCWSVPGPLRTEPVHQSPGLQRCGGSLE